MSDTPTPAHPDDRAAEPDEFRPRWTVGSFLAVLRMTNAQKAEDHVEMISAMLDAWARLYGRPPGDDRDLEEIAEEVAAAVNLLGTRSDR